MPDSLRCAAVAAVASIIASCGSGTGSQRGAVVSAWNYPFAERGDQVDDYHGTSVADPYRWLEDSESAQTRGWVDAENALTLPYLAALPARDDFARRLTELFDYERFSLPEWRSGRYVYSYNSGTQEQDSVWTTTDIRERGNLLIDAAELSDDGTASISGYALSPDGRLLAYGVSDGGTDWRIWRVRNVLTGRDLGDELRGIKFSGVSWSEDGNGFYYSRYPRAETGDAYDDQRQVSVWYHALGSEQADDVEVYRVPDSKTRNPYATLTDDGDYLVIELFDGYKANAFYYKRMRDGVADAEDGASTRRLGCALRISRQRRVGVLF